MAGFIDGEGCIRASRNVRVIIAGCFDPAILLSLHARYGGNLSPYKARRPRQRNGTRWEVTGERAARLLRDVLPYLIEKRSQAEIAIRYDALKRSVGCRGGKGHTSENKALFREMEQQLRDLKRVQYAFEKTLA